MTYRLARASARRPRRTLALWALVFVAGAAAVAVLLPSALTTEAEMTNDPESYRGYAVIRDHFPPAGEDEVNELVVVRSASLTVATAPFRAKVERLAADLEATGATVRTYYSTGERSLVSPSGRATVLTIGLGGDPEERVEEVIDVVQGSAGGGFETAITGEWTADRDFTTLSEEDLRKGEFQFGLPGALVVLLLVFGAVVAGLVPVLAAVVSIVVALGLTALVGQAFDLSVFVVNMLTGMGLALGIDYALFIVSRYREERRHGSEKMASIERVGGTASRAVLFSGSAFVLAMLGMVLVPDTILRSLATGAILVGIVSVVAALTLLPALLAVLGDRVNAGRIPWLGRRVEESAGSEGRLWGRAVRAVLRAPVLSAGLSVAFLLLLAAPVLGLETGLQGVRTLPDRFTAKQGFVLLEQEFGVGTPDSVEVVVAASDVTAAAVRRGVDALRGEIASDPVFLQPEVSVSDDRQVAVVESLVAGDSRDERALRAVGRLRSEVAPRALAGSGATVLVTGETAETIDYLELTDTWLPIVFAFVLGLSFVLLTVAFRSVVLPAVAIALNLLSVGAAYGLLVLVFQEGYGNDLLGFQQVETIAAWLPLFLFAVLFGLSMDYTVFLMSRIRERYAQGHSTGEAVAWSVATTARLITGAALIIIVVFVGFATGDQVEFQQMGFGVAVSLLIDATLIRLVLLPAVLGLLGERSWYLPRWLGWIPHVEIEGHASPAQVADPLPRGSATRENL